MLFYSAVHLVLAKMVESPLRYGETQEERARRTHDDIFGYIRDDKYLIKIYRPYNVLFRLSRRARYDVWKPGDHDMKNAEKAFGQVRDYFIKTFPNWFKRPRGQEA